MSSQPFPIINTYLFFSFFLLLSLNQLLHTNFSVALARSETDRRALTAIRDGMQGLSMWNQSIHFCQWQGITCSKFHQRVIGLDLSSQSLAGTISPHVGNLTSLTSITLQNNKFSGEIPQEIGWLFRLQNLNIANNNFQGMIPVSLSRCTGLEIINFSGNRLTGKIPPEIGSLSKLVILDFKQNALTGQIPPSLELGMGCEVSIQSDVYSFGILVLETFIGKRPTDEMFKDGLNLHNYASNALPDKVSQIVDPIILAKEDEMAGASNTSDRKAQVQECFTAIIRIGVACSMESPKERMNIRDVTEALHTIRKKMNFIT